MNMARLLVGFESENANNLKPRADVRMCVVATPLVVRQIQSNGQTQPYRRGPGVHPTPQSLRPGLCLGGISEASDDIRVGGTDRLMCYLPVCLLTLLGLHRNGDGRKRFSTDIEGAVYL